MMAGLIIAVVALQNFKEANAMQAQDQSDIRLHRITGDYLTKIGPKLNVHFTIEYLAGTDALWESEEPFDAGVATLEALVKELEKKLPNARIVVDHSDKNHPVLHIIDEHLGKKNEVLDKTIDLHFSGVVGNLYVTLAKIVPDIDSRLSGWGWESYNDYETKVDIDVKQKRLRDILTHCVDLDEYRPLIWTAKTYKNDKGEWKTQIRFTGPKPVGREAP